MNGVLIQDVTFGDCDPAGIVFYPNVIRWMDAAFHSVLRNYGGHTGICKSLGVLGLVVIDSSVEFTRPMRDGDKLEIQVTVVDWSQRAFTLAYSGRVDGVSTFTGREVRCVFEQSETGMSAADTSALRALIGNHDAAQLGR